VGLFSASATRDETAQTAISSTGGPAAPSPHRVTRRPSERGATGAESQPVDLRSQLLIRASNLGPIPGTLSAVEQQREAAEEGRALQHR
jgi:hypothetical protein